MSLILSITIYWENDDDQSNFNLICQLVVYSILPIVYIWTLCSMRKAMDQLLRNQISRERRSVLNQFILLIVSYVTRVIWYIVEIFILESFNDFTG